MDDLIWIGPALIAGIAAARLGLRPWWVTCCVASC